LLEIQFAIIGGFIYYPSRVYHAYKGGKGGIVVEGDDWKVGCCSKLCDYSL